MLRVALHVCITFTQHDTSENALVSPERVAWTWTSPLCGQLFGYCINDRVELFIRLALAVSLVSHGELRVDQLAVNGHLESATLAPGVNVLRNLDLGAKFIDEEGSECGSKLGVASA